MKNCRDPYPFHRQPNVALGYRPVTPLPVHRKRRLFAGAVGYIFIVSVASLAVAGFFTP